LKFISNIDRERFNQFTKNHPKSHFAQSYEWGQFKAMSPDWGFDAVGLEDENGDLVAAALVLLRYLPLIKRPFLYCPRGYVLDFGDTGLLRAFTTGMKSYAKKKKAIFIKIDPDLKYLDRDPQGQPLEGAHPRDGLLKSLALLGYRHQGFAQDFESTIQPRYTFRLDLSKEEGELLKGLHSKTRYNLKMAQKRGIEIIEGTREDLKIFGDIMSVTGNRNGFLTRPLSYFEEMYDTLNPVGKCKLYLARLNTKSALEAVEKELEAARQAVDQLKTQLAQDGLQDKKRQKLENKLAPEVKKTKNLSDQQKELEGLYEKHPDGVNMSGIITTYYGDKAWYLYGASDEVFREFMPNYLIQWQALSDAKEAGFDIYDFFGISGRTDEADPLHGLYRFKKGFGGEFTEFIGEFDLVISPLLYALWTKVLPAFKRYKKRLAKR